MTRSPLCLLLLVVLPVSSCPSRFYLGGRRTEAVATCMASPRSSVAERRLEYRFLSLPSPAKAREAHAFLTADPHIAGSPRDRVLAEWVRDRWREYGLEQVEIVEHQVLLPYPIDVRVETTLRPAATGRRRGARP